MSTKFSILVCSQTKNHRKNRNKNGLVVTIHLHDHSMIDPVETGCDAWRCRYDVNVTPDKRKVMLHGEKAMLAALQEVDPYDHATR